MSKVDCKIVLLGRHSVGKTTLSERYLHGEFNSKSTATIGAAFSAKHVNVNGEDVTLGIWDTAGAERYESMSRIYYRGAKAALICYDMTDEESFAKVEFWVQELTENEPECALYVVGTKADKLAAGSERGVEALEARNYATQHGARYHETSAMSGKGISELFEDVAAHFVAQRAGLTSATAKPNAAAANSANTAAASASAAKSRGNADKSKPVNLNAKQRKPNAKRGAAEPKGGGCCD